MKNVASQQSHTAHSTPESRLLWLGIACASMALSACSSLDAGSTAPAVTRSVDSRGLLGCWQGANDRTGAGTGTGTGVGPAWRIERKPDQTFRIEFAVPGGPPQQETGRWAVEGTTYTTVTVAINGKPVEPFDPGYTDRYELREVAGDSVTLYNTRSHSTFKSVRVACGTAVGLTAR